MDVLPPISPATQTPSADTEVTPKAKVEPKGDSFGAVMERLGERLDSGEKLAQSATHVKPGLDAGQLIALQAGIYRYTETVELASKLVDKVGNAVKTTMQSQ
jgi:hypothetical protein